MYFRHFKSQILNPLSMNSLQNKTFTHYRRAFTLLATLLTTVSLAIAQCGVQSEFSNYSINCGESVYLDVSQQWLKPFNSSNTYNGIYFINANVGYITGEAGKILKTINGGKSWSALNSNTTYNLQTIQFTDINTGYVVGNLSSNSVILKTTDGGVNWSKISPVISTELSTIYFFNKNHGYAVGTNGVILKTDNGGDTWIQKNSNTLANLKSIHFPNMNVGYAVGEDVLLNTSDGGETWTVLPSCTGNGLKSMGGGGSEWSSLAVSVFFTDENTGYVASDAGILYSTNDGAKTWKSSYLNNGGIDSGLGFIYFIDSQTGYAGGGHYIFKTTDQGNTWHTFSTEGGRLRSCSFTNSDTYYVAGYGVLKLTNRPFDKITWSPSIGLSASDIANPIASPNVTTKYTVTAEFEGCTSSTDITITVSPLIINNNSIGTTCGDPKELSLTTNYMGSNLTYKWSPSTGLNASDIKNPVATVNSTTTYTLEVKTDNGCSATASETVIVNPLNAFINYLQIPCGNVANLGITTNYSNPDQLTYTWSPATGLSNPNIKDPEVAITSNTNYSVEVKTNSGCVATSIAEILTTKINLTPSICYVTVNDNHNNVIEWQQEDNINAKWIYIYRESSFLTDYYDLIGKVAYSATGSFVDLNSNAQIQSNKYKIGVQDKCGYYTEKSSEHKTTHLTINKGIDKSWNLIWEQYTGKTVANYKIYRGTNLENLTEIGSTSGSNTTYTDLSAPSGPLYYVIEVNFTNACTALKSTQYGSSRSNIINTSTLITTIKDTNSNIVNIYPNPAKETLNIEGVNYQTASLIIMNLQGKEVINQPLNSAIVDISNLPNNVYLIKIIDGKNLSITKFIKE